MSCEFCALLLPRNMTTPSRGLLTRLCEIVVLLVVHQHLTTYEIMCVLDPT